MYNIKTRYAEYMILEASRIEGEYMLQLKTKQKLETINTSIESENDANLILENYYNYKEILIDTITLEFNDISNKTLSDELRPNGEGYGYDFPCCLIKKYNINKEKTTTDKIVFIINAEDQNWGGTGHINVRYTLNSNNSEIGFFINREVIQDEINNCGIEGINNIDTNNHYLIEFYKQDLQEGDNILTFYLFCPKWNGSVGHVKNIKVNKGVKIYGIN